MRKDIRKISVGNGHPDQMMHYQVGKNYTLSKNNYTLSSIIFDSELSERGKIGYNIYLQDQHSQILWKTIIDVPVVVEYNIDFI